ncbi:MAG: PTS fructose transporter subunit IIA [Candidatus Competibacteraceae bacterium]|nr:PTS fructose transporter subunit IIA [Candidatus Competibacteraceae bacterium]
MSVGLLLITHNHIAEELLGTAMATLDGCPLPTRILAVTETRDCQRLLEQARQLAREVDEGQGTLVLTDLFGATPGNIATGLLDRQTVVVSGLSLPMLIRVLNYAPLDLTALALKAVSGGRDGIILSTLDDQEKPTC